MISSILAVVLAALAAIGAFFGWTAKVKRDERKAIEDRQTVERATAVLARKDADAQAAGASDAQLRDELRRHQRPPTRS